MINPLTFLASIKTTLIASAVCLAFGFGGGWYVKAKFVAASEVHQVVKAQHQSATNVVESAKASDKLESDIQLDKNIRADITRQVAARLALQKEKRNAQLAQDHVDPAKCPAPVLDAGTVRLLNSARDGAAVDPSAGGNAAGKSPAQAASR